ncbi:hypothetical protein EB796_004945 [Bugula neritina]|uniref:Uncharacterized protein n=1 Tax=Bugula neritina TaxID=10212 RepID=A0A7J7KEU2_BUGNE|nr:hypothetical protein EB796_004945 [Bugula neritina]
MATYFNRDDSLLLKEDVLYVIVYLVGKALTISSTLQYVLLIQYCIQVYFYIPSETILYIQVIGVCVLAVGIAVQVQLKNYLELTQLYYENTAYIMIAIGVLILLVALAGFYCTAKDKIALLYMYGVFISLLAIVQIGAGLSNTINDTSLRKYWDDVQQQLHCCGVETHKDWGSSLPSSCYPDNVVPLHPFTPFTPCL